MKPIFQFMVMFKTHIKKVILKLAVCLKTEIILLSYLLPTIWTYLIFPFFFFLYKTWDQKNPINIRNHILYQKMI